MPPAKEDKEEEDNSEKDTFNDFDHMCSIKRCSDLSFQFGVLFPDPLQPSHQEHAHFCLILSIFFF